MFKIESICEKTTNYIAQELNLDNDKKAVVNYGIFAFIQMGICLLSVVIFGFVFNVTLEATIISFTTSILRKSSGGAHANSPRNCAIIGTIVSVGMAIAIKNIYINILSFVLVGIIIFIWAYVIVNKLAPVDSVAKPIKSIEKRIRLKKSSIRILVIYIIVIITNIMSYLYVDVNNYTFITCSLCIYTGVLWQVFSLTKSGHNIFENINNILK